MPIVRDAKLSQFLAEAPDVLAKALDAVTQTLSNFARNCLAAGADGIYLAVRDDWVDTPENGAGVYDRLVRGSDLKILAAAAGGSLNILHVCGKPLDFRRFGQYPVQALNWADRIGGPPIADVAPWLGPAICGGIDNLGTLVSGSPEEIKREVADAVRQAAGRPIMIAPGLHLRRARCPAVPTCTPFAKRLTPGCNTIASPTAGSINGGHRCASSVGEGRENRETTPFASSGTCHPKLASLAGVLCAF